MFKLPCPWCGAKLHASRETVEEARNQGSCPTCKLVVHLLSEDDADMWESFPLVKWAPCDDGRSSRSHVALAKCGINGTEYFRRDDPILEGWWIARRKGVRPCRCMTIAVYKSDVAKLGLPSILVTPPPFDPWDPADDCMLMGWGNKYSTWNDAEYEHHPGNPDRGLASAIDSVLPGGPPGLSMNEVRERLIKAGVADDPASLLYARVARGLCKRTGHGKRNDPYRFHRNV